MTLMHQLDADLLTIRRSRSVKVVAAVAVFLAALLTGALAFTHSTDEPAADLTTAFGQGEILIDPITGLLLAALVAAFIGASFRDGSILWSFIAARSRTAVAVSALVTSAVLGLVVGLIAMAAKIGALHVMLPDGIPASWWEDRHGQVAVVGGVVTAVVMALIGAAASLLLRNASVAIGVVLGWMLVLEPLLVGLLPRQAWTWLPAHAISAIRNAVPDANLTRAALMVVAYLALAVAGAIVITQRRDPA